MIFQDFYTFLPLKTVSVLFSAFLQFHSNSNRCRRKNKKIHWITHLEQPINSAISKLQPQPTSVSPKEYI